MEDSVIFSLIAEEEDRQRRGVELIASENFVSPHVLRAAGSVLTNKYAEGLPGRRYYGGCQVVDEIENTAIARAKALFRVEWANVQPHSGAQANAAVMLALLAPGDKILGFDLSHGGHLTHGSPVNYSGKLYEPYFYGVERGSERINYDTVASIAKKERPKLIICGASSYSRDWDYKSLRETADSVGAILLGDISHPSGLIAKSLLNDPFDYCHVVSTTTHKTLRGPRGGLLMMRHDFENPMGIRTKKGKLRSVSSLLDSGVFPGTQGGPLEHVIAAKGVAFGEALAPIFLNYSRQVQKNARCLAVAFKERGYRVVSGGTDNHMVTIDLTPHALTGKEAQEILESIDVTVNKNMIPFDTKSPSITSGIRLGTPALTTRGLVEADMQRIVGYIHEAFAHKDDQKRLGGIKAEINTWMRQKPMHATG